MKWNISLSVMAGVVLMVLGTGAWATDLDEQYRPLLDKGQVLWDFDLAYASDWSHSHSYQLPPYGTGATDAYSSLGTLAPSTGIRVGLAKGLTAFVYGDFAHMTSPRVAGHSDRWNGLAGMVYRPTEGFQVDASVSEQSWDAGGGGRRNLYTDASSHFRQESAVVSLSWLTKPKASYVNLMPDLDGLERPILDGGQNLLTASLSVTRDWADWYFWSAQSNVPGGYARWGEHAFDQNQWRLHVADTLGLGAGWEVRLGGSYTDDYDSVAKMTLYTLPPWSTTNSDRTTHNWDGDFAIVKRWGKQVEAECYTHYSTSRMQAAPGYHYYGYWGDETWVIGGKWSVVSKPSRAGAPLRADMDGLKRPQLDRGQIRWDGNVEWSRDKDLIGWHDMSGKDFYAPVWKFATGAAYGLPSNVEIRMNLFLNPNLSTMVPPVEWRHGYLGASVAWRPTKRAEFRAGYQYGLDHSGQGGMMHYWSEAEHHLFTAGMTWLW